MRGGVRTYIYCQPPAGGRIRSQANKMHRLRRRNHEWEKGWLLLRRKKIFLYIFMQSLLKENFTNGPLLTTTLTTAQFLRSRT